MLVVCALITLITVASLWLFVSRRRKQELIIPGMIPSTKKDGNLGDIKESGGFYEFLTKLHAKFGPIASFWYGQVYTVSIASPELFKQHLRPFDRPAMLFEFLTPMIGRASIQLANGEDGHNRRKMYDRAYAHDKLCSYFSIFQRSAEVVVRQWSAKEEDDLIPLCDETFKFSVRSALCSVLGEYCENDEIVSDFRKAYVKAIGELNETLNDPTYRGKPEKMCQFNEALEFMKEIVKRALEHRRKTAIHGTLVVDEILEYTSDEDTVLGDCMTYLVGAFHNVGNVLAFSLQYLAKHEDVQEKLYKEIIEVLGDAGLVQDSNLRNLKYMRQVIDESMRCGVFGIFAARCHDDDIMLGGYNIPKNTPVIQALGVVMRDENVWPMPATFDPDRFNEENRKSRHPFAFEPFGFSGKRKCPGYKLVHPQMAVFLATVLKRFQIKEVGEQQMTYKYGIATYSAEEMWVKIIKR